MILFKGGVWENGWLKDQPSSFFTKAELANPITYIHADMPPMLIQHGRQDHLVPVQQSIIFAQALNSAGLSDRFEFDILEKADHADPLFETPENMERVFRFLDHHLKEKDL